MRGFVAAWLLLAGAAPERPLDAAKAHLAKGDLDGVLFALGDLKLPDSDKGAAADVLGAAAFQAWDKKDPIFALQFAQMALRLNPDHAQALDVGARACLAQQQFDPAEKYADRLLEVSPRAEARLLRAEIALQQGEWQKVVTLVKKIDPKALASDDRAHLAKLLETATKELRERQEGLEQAIKMQKQLEAAAERAKREPPTARESAPRARPPVVLYGTSWCGYCKAAARWLRQRGVDFVERDIEKDEAAAAELERKKRASGRSGSGVPWIDVGGTLIQGFDRRALEELFPG